MNWNNIKNRIFFVSVIFISAGILFPSGTGFSQNYLRINDDIGGGNNNTTSESNSNDNTFVYVLGGAVIAGILVYALFIKKKSRDSETDSTSALNSSNYIHANKFDNIKYEVEKSIDKIPFDISIGVRNNKALLNDKTYMMGVSVRF